MSDEKLFVVEPANTPYARRGVSDLFKEDHKNLIRVLASEADAARPLRLLDVGCANGECLYRLKQAFPGWRLSGVDLSADYIAAASAAPELAGIDFSVASVFAVEGRWDVVISTGVVEIFTDPTEVLQKLVSLVAPGGLLVVDGRFNPLDVDVRMQFRDRSPGSRSQVWNTDWNLHAQRTVREILDGRVKSLRFDEVAMDADLPYRADQPASRTWTFRDAAGRNLQTNGAGILKNKHLLIARR